MQPEHDQDSRDEDPAAAAMVGFRDHQAGRVGWALAWLLGVPLPLPLVIWRFTRAS